MSYPDLRIPETIPGGNPSNPVPVQKEKVPVIDDGKEDDMEGC